MSVERATSILADWRSGMPWEAMSAKYDSTPYAMRAVVKTLTTEEDREDRRGNLIGHAQRKFTDDDLLGMLRTCAADLGRTPGAAAFDRWVGVFWSQLLLMRFGSWREACLRVGLTPHAKPPGMGEPTYSEGDCLAAYSRIKDAAGKVTVEAWAAHCLPSEPCAGTLRRRYGRWTTVKREMESRLTEAAA